MTSRPRSSSRKKTDTTENKVIYSDNGSLAVHLTTGAEAVKLSDTDHILETEPVFVVFDEAEKNNKPLAWCCITTSADKGHDTPFACSALFTTQKLMKRHPDLRFLEVSIFRIVDEKKAHRARGLLWQAITLYCAENSIDYILGCFSFDGKYPAEYALELSYLHHFCQTEPHLQLQAHNGASMDIMPVEAVKPKEVFRFLPPLLRYYLRLGAKAAKGAAISSDKAGIDVLLLIPAQSMKISPF
ncbi:MAG: Lysophospholipid acyltransferase, LPLAT superfamily protein [Candidatus Tokpelaia hoelldobleri]|uniref:Lysophospholipid acyltransferase, LPLAT superfamily protein n=1 Tax=Candidatus Tokpelaia hoelldobleri TaxID=1902579 RepID=A0A1U9JSA4_9HYPH|nr:MAG: Lysophospholipid acyltransferase, LPLAT superfamily protein [Candidatus Tokpelaia hoelldoblerii]